MKKLFILLLVLSTVILFGCKAKAPAVASSSSSDLDIQVSAPVSSDTSSIADSSTAPSAVSSAISSAISSKPVSSHPKAIAPASSSRTVSSSRPTNPVNNNDKQIAEENARHAAALKSLTDTYNANMALFTERDKYIAQRTALQTSIDNETDSAKKTELNKELTECQNNIFDNYYKILAILHPERVGKMHNAGDPKYPSAYVLKDEINTKYNSDIAAENSKHNEIIKRLG